MPWYVYIAFKQLFPTGKWLPNFFFCMSVLGVTLGVMLLVIVQSVMAGFQKEIRQKMVEFNGHVTVQSAYLLEDYEPLLDKLEADPRVASTSPFAMGVIMLQHANRPVFPAVRGVDMTREQIFLPLEQYLLQGSLEDLDDDSILMSRELAVQTGAFVGSIVEIYTPLMIERLTADEVLLPIELRVAGIFETGWSQIDANTSMVTLRRMQELYGLGEAIHGIGVRVKPDVNEFAFAADINGGLLGFGQRAETWMQRFEDFLWVLQLEKTMLLFLLLFIVLVAAFAIAVAQLLTVIRKTREIGLLGSMGGKAWQLIVLYCFQGFFIGLLGTSAGCLLAVTILHYRSTIIEGLTSVFGGENALVQFYQFSQLPVNYQRADFVVITISALLLSTLAGWVPAWRAANMKPADALRIE